MIFSSIPAYLDPSNWQQQQDHQIIGSSGTTSNPLLTPPPPPPPPQPHVGGGIGSIRPGSMSERARMANIPLPETQLKCPRCESTNTKFCYFNNYSLSQPRHFCKTCRRYWTRGGALRSVPVGGGCRRNKRSKSTSSKSPANRGESQTTSTSPSYMATANTATASMLGLTPPLRFMSPLSHQLNDNFASDIGLNYGISAPMVGTREMIFNGGNNLFGGGGGVASLLSSGGGIESWKLQQLQQFPFLGNPDSSIPGVYSQFQGGGESGFVDHHQLRPNVDHHQMRPKFSSSFMTQLSSVKMEDNPNELNLSRQLMGGSAVLPGGNDHQWNTTSANWTELSSFSSSSTSNAL